LASEALSRRITEVKETAEEDRV